MERRLGADEFDEWVAKDKISPLDGIARLERMLGILCALMVNRYRRNSSSRGYSWQDFAPDYRKLALEQYDGAEPEAPVDIGRKLRLLTIMMGGKVIPRGERS